MRTRPADGYMTPSAAEIKEVAQRLKLNKYSLSLVADLCNLAAGGVLTLPFLYKDEVRKIAETSLETPCDRGWSIASGYTLSRSTAIDEKAAKLLRYHQNVQDFLGAVDFSDTPGNSPLEQAISFLKLLSLQSGGLPGNDGDALPIFSDSDYPEGAAEKINTIFEEVENLSEVERKLLEEKNQDSTLQGLKIAEDMASDKRHIVEISRKLDAISKLAIRKKKEFTPSPDGEEVQTRFIKELSELTRVIPSEWALKQQSPTLFNARLAQNQLRMRERGTLLEKKQAVFVLFDGTGSMSGTKHYKATGIVLNRIKAVISEDAELWLSVFDTSMKEVHFASDPEEGKKLLDKFKSGNFSGGGTDIANSIKAAIEFINAEMEKKPFLYKPEIVIITDDDDSCQITKAERFASKRMLPKSG